MPQQRHLERGAPVAASWRGRAPRAAASPPAPCCAGWPRPPASARVFSPQSGLTQSCSARSTLAAAAQQLGHLLGRRDARRVDVVDARADLLCVAGALPVVQQLHARARRLDQQHVGVHLLDLLHDVAEVRVAHVGVDLGLVAHRRGRDPEAVDGPLQVLVPAVAAQRQPLADRRLVDLDHLDPGLLEVGDLVADRERELLAGLRARLVVADERPLEHRHRAGEHPLDRLAR